MIEIVNVQEDCKSMKNTSLSGLPRVDPPEAKKGSKKGSLQGVKILEKGFNMGGLMVGVPVNPKFYPKNTLFQHSKTGGSKRGSKGGQK